MKGSPESVCFREIFLFATVWVSNPQLGKKIVLPKVFDLVFACCI